MKLLAAVAMGVALVATGLLVAHSETAQGQGGRAGSPCFVEQTPPATICSQTPTPTTTKVFIIDCGYPPFSPCAESTPTPCPTGKVPTNFSAPGGCGTPTPTPTADFGLGIDVNGDGVNDCGTGVPGPVGDGAPDPVSADVTNTGCHLVPDQLFTVRVYLTRVPVPYVAQISQVYFMGITSNAPGAAVWTGCVFAAPWPPNLTDAAYVGVYCMIGIGPPAGPVDYLGLVSTFEFRCNSSGSIWLGYGPGETSIDDENLQEIRGTGSDQLNIDCGPAPTPTPTFHLVVPCGDVNGNGSIDVVDALLVLQYVAGKILYLPGFPADLNTDGLVNAVDAAIILQYEAGLVPLSALPICEEVIIG